MTGAFALNHGPFNKSPEEMPFPESKEKRSANTNQSPKDLGPPLGIPNFHLFHPGKNRNCGNSLTNFDNVGMCSLTGTEACISLTRVQFFIFEACLH